MQRELVVLGTAAQVPTRHRNHVGFVLRWDGDSILFDPGEASQRQMLHAGVTAHDLGHICITHLHGDHCLGLPGVLARISLDRVGHRVHLHYPSMGVDHIANLRRAAVFDDRGDIEEHPIEDDGVIARNDRWTLTARRLDHSVDAYGYRLDEQPGRTFLPDRLEATGVTGPAVGELERAGEITVGGRTVHLDEVSVERRAQSFALIMDTRVCDAAVELARNADLVVSESTFLEPESDIAHDYHHLTAREAATIASEAGARRLVLAHYSQRHPEEDDFLAEAAGIHPDVVAARDLDVIAVPARSAPRTSRS